MIRCSFERQSDGSLVAYELEGHALFAAPGEDIVCAGVSAVSQAVTGGIAQVVDLEPEPRVERESGRLRCRLRRSGAEEQPGGWDEAQALMETLLLALKDLAEQYPERIEVSVSTEASDHSEDV